MVDENLTILYLDKLNELSEGNVNPKEASIWAESELNRLKDRGTVLALEQEELLDNLLLAGMPNGQSGFLYGKEDFKSWIQDWKNNHPGKLI